MTDSREFYASTVDEAVEKAALELGLSSAEISYRVLDEGNSGFLGIGARDARIIVEAQALHKSGEEVESPETTPVVNVAVDVPASEPSDDAGDSGSSTQSEVYRESSESQQVEAPEELLDEIRTLVSSVLDAMGFEARVEVYDAGGFIAADVATDNTALFIGQKGETIDALQYLINVAAFRERRFFFKRVVLDAEGYRQRRVEAIQGMAHRTARRAVRERRTVEMPPMNSSERRVVHLFLSDNPSVTTESEGTGDNRRVKVSPTNEA
jgi:spoIIIJ-associated protein